MNDPQGLGQAFSDEEFSVRDALGGPRGITESVSPTLLFVILFAATRDAVMASVVAVVIVVALVIARLVQRQPIGPAMSGAVAVVIGALIAIRSGDGSGFYIPGLIINAAWAIGLTVSVLARHPLVGYVAAALDPKVSGWRLSRAARSIYSRATWVYAGLFTAKVAVQAPLYFLGLTDALGVAKLLMGLPAFALVTYVIYVMHRRAVALLTPVYSGPDHGDHPSVSTQRST